MSGLSNIGLSKQPASELADRSSPATNPLAHGSRLPTTVENNLLTDLFGKAHEVLTGGKANQAVYSSDGITLPDFRVFQSSANSWNPAPKNTSAPLPYDEKLNHKLIGAGIAGSIHQIRKTEGAIIIQQSKPIKLEDSLVDKVISLFKPKQPPPIAVNVTIVPPRCLEEMEGKRYERTDQRLFAVGISMLLPGAMQDTVNQLVESPDKLKGAMLSLLNKSSSIPDGDTHFEKLKEGIFAPIASLAAQVASATKWEALPPGARSAAFNNFECFSFK